MFSKNVISALDYIISEYGNVEEIISDNEKQFMAKENKNFATHLYPAELLKNRR